MHLAPGLGVGMLKPTSQTGERTVLGADVVKYVSRHLAVVHAHPG